MQNGSLNARAVRLDHWHPSFAGCSKAVKRIAATKNPCIQRLSSLAMQLKTNTVSLFHGEKLNTPFHQRALQRFMLASALLTTLIFLESLWFTLSPKTTGVLIAATSTFWLLYLQAIRRGCHDTLLWIYIAANHGIILLDWIVTGGHYGVALSVAIIISGTVPIFTPADHLLKATASSVALFLVLILSTFVFHDSPPLDSSPLAVSIDRILESAILASGLYALSFFTIRSLAAQTRQQQASHSLGPHCPDSSSFPCMAHSISQSWQTVHSPGWEWVAPSTAEGWCGYSFTTTQETPQALPLDRNPSGNTSSPTLPAHTTRAGISGVKETTDIDPPDSRADVSGCSAGFEAKAPQLPERCHTGGVSAEKLHDLKNVLSSFVTYPQLLLLDLDDSHEMKKHLEFIHSCGNRANSLIHDIIRSARDNQEPHERIRLNDVVNQFFAGTELSLMRLQHPEIIIEKNLSNLSTFMMGSRQQLYSLLLNLVANAIESIPRGGSVCVTTSVADIHITDEPGRTVPEGHYLVLRVADTGTGIPDNFRETIFEPHFTTKPVGRSGTGLGMTIVQNVVRENGGYLHIADNGQTGTVFCAYFPIPGIAALSFTADARQISSATRSPHP